MRWSHSVGRLFGIEIRIHVTFWLLLAWLGFSFYTVGGLTAGLMGVLFIMALFVCVLLHEMGHAQAARRYGIETPDITLLPIGGVARLQRMPEKSAHELVVAVAGPLVNVVIAAILILFLREWPGWPDLTAWDDPLRDFISNLAAINVILVVFNMVPAFPMDGGRVLRALLAMVLPYGRATGIAATIGQTLAFVLGLIGLLGLNPILILIAVFVFFGAQQEAILGQIQDLGRNLSVGEATTTHLRKLDRNSSLDDALEMLMHTPQREFPILDEEERLLGVLLRDDMVQALRKHPGDAPAVDFMRSSIPTVRPSTSFQRAFEVMQGKDLPVVAVVDRHGNFIGLLTRESIGELMMLHSVGRPDDKPLV